MFLSHQRFLDGIGTADGGAVALAVSGVTGADTLYPGYLLGDFMVVGSEQVSLKGSGGAQHSLELNAGDHVGIFAVPVARYETGVEVAEAG
jgi:hypothetical protein